MTPSAMHTKYMGGDHITILAWKYSRVVTTLRGDAKGVRTRCSDNFFERIVPCFLAMSAYIVIILSYIVLPNVVALYYPQVIADISLAISFGYKFWNVNGTCSVAGTIYDVPVIEINTSSQLPDLAYYRVQYPPHELVIFYLSQLDAYVVNASGYPVFQPAYAINDSLIWRSNMSCSYITGQGVKETSILLRKKAIDEIQPVVYGSNLKDLLLVDLTIDRTNESFYDVVYPCQLALNFPSQFSNATKFLLENDGCVKWISVYNSFQDYAISLTILNRVHMARIQTWTGIRMTYVYYTTLSSSFITSLQTGVSIEKNP